MKIDCFEWQNLVSDYLDGTLSNETQRTADQHLENCKVCEERLKHYRAILATLVGQPRTLIPPAIKKHPIPSPFSQSWAPRMSFIHWDSIPWYLRVLLQSLGIVVGILACVSSAPKLRAIYERNVERNMNDFKEGFEGTTAEESDTDPNFPSLQKKVSGPSTGDSEISGEDEDTPTIGVAGRSHLWRFTLKTVSPEELRTQVMNTFTQLKIPTSTPGLGGVQVPGGIEFDLILPHDLAPQLKKALEDLMTLPASQTEGHSENFSWYKVKFKGRLPEGTVRVVIWLSQPSG